jgi:hypothetical protein
MALISRYSRYRVEAARMPGMALHDPPYGEQSATCKSMTLECLGCIAGAGRMESAASWQKRGYIAAVKANCPDQQDGQGPKAPHVSFFVLVAGIFPLFVPATMICGRGLENRGLTGFVHFAVCVRSSSLSVYPLRPYFFKFRAC